MVLDVGTSDTIQLARFGQVNHLNYVSLGFERLTRGAYGRIPPADLDEW